MPIFELEREFSGYSRGIDKVSVEAETLEEAIEKADSEMFERDVVRDDRHLGEWEDTSQ